MFDDINQEIRTNYANTSTRVASNMGTKAAQWARDHKLNLGQLMVDGPILDGIHNAQLTRIIYTSQAEGSVEAGLCAEQLLDDLTALDFDLDAAPQDLREAEFTAPGQLINIHGRPVSVDFLYRLNICQRIGDVLREPGIVILEIGAGLGALSRTIKLINPDVKYVIIDLLDTLVVSYGFLRASFPEATTKFVTDNTQLSQLEIDSDFTFIPAQLIPLKGTSGGVGSDEMPRLEFDLAVNTQSLGEMRQDVTEGYMDLIENRLNVKRFYSLNHFLQQEARLAQWRPESEQSSFCTPIGPYWDVLRWEYSPPFVGHTRFGDQDSTLELYAQKIDRETLGENELRERSDRFLAEANSLGELRGHRWQRLMWDSVRFCPRRENLEPYYKFLKDSNRRQSRYFGRLLAGLGVEVEQPFTVPTPEVATSVFKKSPQHLAAAVLRRLADKIEPTVVRPKQDFVPTL